MKSVKQILVLLAVGAAITVVSGCGSYPRVVEHKGTALGIKETPQWVTTYVSGTTRAIEALPEYKNVYVIIGSEVGPELQQVMTWVNNFNAQQQIGALIETRAASVFRANESKVPDEAISSRSYENSINTVISARYTGARREGDWWVKKEYKDGQIEYEAYIIYTIEKQNLIDQINSQLAEIRNTNPALSDFVDAVSAELLLRGLD